jgi:hypothetical protein
MQYGDWIVWLCILSLAFIVIAMILKRPPMRQMQ